MNNATVLTVLDRVIARVEAFAVQPRASARLCKRHQYALADLRAATRSFAAGNPWPSRLAVLHSVRVQVAAFDRAAREEPVRAPVTGPRYVVRSEGVDGGLHVEARFRIRRFAKRCMDRLVAENQHPYIEIADRRGERSLEFIESRARRRA